MGWRWGGQRADDHSLIREVVRRREFHIDFQPVVDLKTGTVFGYEALARGDSPHFPGAWPLIKAGVEAGLSGELGRLLRKMSMDGCSNFPLFVNVNPNEFNEGWLVQPDDPIFLHDESVFLEITESVPLSHFEHCHNVLNEVRRKGISLAIDDLGAGYSNLKYITDLNPEVVKLDRGLVAGIKAGTRQQRFVKAIVSLCQDFEARVVAEGIETVDELEAVIDAGADFGQGFLLARPAFPPPSVKWPPEETT